MATRLILALVVCVFGSGSASFDAGAVMADAIKTWRALEDPATGGV